MDKTAIIVSAVVGSLGVLSALLGFIAEGAAPYNTSPALGICASLFLLAAQITVSAVGGCCGCCKSPGVPSETNRIVGVICAVVSWILAVIALALFFRGASLDSTGYYYQPGLYAGGAVLVLAATALGITSFIMLLRSQPPAPAGVGVVPVVGASSNRPSTTQQPPMAFMMGAQPQTPPSQAPSAPTMPVVQPVPAGVAMGHPVSLPVADAGKQLPPAVVPIGQPAVALGGTVIIPREQPMLHTAGTTMQPQVSQTQGQVYTLQPQSQHPVQLQPQNGQLPQPQHADQPHVPLATLPQGNKSENKPGIGQQIFKEGAKVGVELAVETLLSDNIGPLAMVGGAITTMAAGAAGGDTGTTGSGDASCQ